MAAIAWILASVVAASAMTISVRQISLGMDAPMIVLLRAGITLIALLPIITFSQNFRRYLRFSRPWQHLIRGALIAVSTNLGFYTLANIPLATAAVLFFMAPVFATILAGPVHGEKVGLRRWSAVAAGFIGAVVILRPDQGELHPAMLTALLSALFFATALTMSRGLATADGPLSTYFSSVVITVVVTLPLAWPVFALPTGGTAWVATAVLVTTGAIRGYADIQAYRLGEASILAPITYLRLVLIGLAGYLFFDETLDTTTVAGAVIIIAATLYIARREALLKRSKS